MCVSVVSVCAASTCGEGSRIVVLSNVVVGMCTAFGGVVAVCAGPAAPVVARVAHLRDVQACVVQVRALCVVMR